MPYEVVRKDCDEPLIDDTSWTSTTTGEVYEDKDVAESRAEALQQELGESYDVGDGGVTTPQFIVRELGNIAT